MSDEITQKLARVERKLEREKLARLEAEKLLEVKSNELYETNQSLQAQIDEAKLQQVQLSFLTGLSADTWVDCTINELTNKFLQRATEFLENVSAVFLKISPQQLHESFCASHMDEQEKQTLIQFCDSFNVTEIFSRFNQEDTESDLIELNIFTDDKDFEMGLFVPVYRVTNLIGVAAFLYKTSDDVNIFKIQTIESARSMLNSAMQRKLGANRLKKRYQELQTTYNKLEQLQMQLVQSEKMASLGQLAAGVAHEINNPVGYVLSNYQTLNEYLEVINQLFEFTNVYMNQTQPDKSLLASIQDFWEDQDIDFIRDDLNELMEASHKGLVRVQEIVAGLKSFSHSDPDKFEPIDMTECIEESIQLVWNELKYDVTLDKQLGESLPVKANSGQLQQVFVNLFVNAKHAMEGGGTLTIKIEQKDQTIVSVCDTGCGISEENQKKLFTPFFTTKPVGEGTGLGLSISYGILQNHNADVQVKSTLGEGTCFIISFPNT